MLDYLSLLAFSSSGWGDDLMLGAMITVILSLQSCIVGFLFGLATAFLGLSRNVIARGIAFVYVQLIRGLPEFLVLLIIAFGGGIAIETIFRYFNPESDFVIEIPKLLAATVALALIFGAYASEVLRGAYNAVPRSQIETAYAYALTERQVFFRIRFPQMMRFALPGLANLWLVLIKDSSLAAVIALDELLRITKVAAENTQLPLFFYFIAALIYLFLTYISDIGRVKLEKYTSRGVQQVRQA